MKENNVSKLEMTKKIENNLFAILALIDDKSLLEIMGNIININNNKLDICKTHSAVDKFIN